MKEELGLELDWENWVRKVWVWGWVIWAEEGKAEKQRNVAREIKCIKL